MIAPIQFRIVIGSYKGHMTKTGGNNGKNGHNGTKNARKKVTEDQREDKQ